MALSKGQLHEHQDPSSGVKIFEREEVLRLWRDPGSEALRSNVGPLTLAEAVALLVHGRTASKEAWRRLRRRHGGRFPQRTQERIEEIGDAIVEMIRNGTIEAFGFRCDGEGELLSPSAGDKECLHDDRAFLAHRLWVDPCTDSIWTEPDLGDGHFNPTNRCYRYVRLSRTQFLEAVRGHHTKVGADCRPAGKQRISTTCRLSKQVFGRAAVLEPRPVGSVVRDPAAKVPTASLNAASSAGVPARNDVGECPKATIPPAPKRGPAPQYDWPLFHAALDQLIREKPDLRHADAVRAMSSWCSEAWGGEDGPGEPANSTLRKHIADHRGAPWAKSKRKRRP